MKLFTNARLFLAFTLLVSSGALAAAFIAQYQFGLEPCILCIYQRIPFAIVIFFSLLGFMSPLGVHVSNAMTGINATAFFTNSVIASYHTGVERKWWASHLEGCSVPDLGSDPDKIMEAIMSAPAVRCDEIPWADPYLGLSMANYNAIACFALFVLCIISMKVAKD